MRTKNILILIIFAITLAYTTSIMFVFPSVQENLLTDVVMRSTLFAIFGYIISNFVNRHLAEKNPEEVQKETKQQLWVVFVICAISAGILAGIRIFSLETEENYLSLALIKHIFSGAVGFLIGLEHVNTDEKYE